MLAACCVLLTVVYVGERYRDLFARLVATKEQAKPAVVEPMPRDVEDALRLFGADWAVDDVRARALEVYAETKDWSRVRAWVSEQQRVYGA